MSVLFRTAITVTRKRPYIDWANSFDDGVKLTEELAHERRTVYLVAQVDAKFDPAAVIEANWQFLFEEELALWMEDEGDWPPSRTREMFDQWFDAEVTDSVFDLDPDEPLTETDVEIADLDYALHTCAWCELELNETEGRMAGFALEDRERFAQREGMVLPVPIDKETVLVGMMSRRDSEAARAGHDLVFHVCSSRCEKAVRKVVPKALRKLLQRS